MTMTIDNWWDLIKEDPADPLRKLAFADWLEEQGGDLTLATALRWYVETNRKPDQDNKKSGHRFTWWRTVTYKPISSYVPRTWKQAPCVSRYYETQFDAVRDLLLEATKQLNKGWISLGTIECSPAYSINV